MNDAKIQKVYEILQKNRENIHILNENCYYEMF